MVQAFGPLPQDTETSQEHTAPPEMEQLTRKELRILTLLAEGYSNSAMAEKLFVSDSTVRTHSRHINLKLGAGAERRRWRLGGGLGWLGSGLDGKRVDRI